MLTTGRHRDRDPSPGIDFWKKFFSDKISFIFCEIFFNLVFFSQFTQCYLIQFSLFLSLFTVYRKMKTFFIWDLKLTFDH